MTSHLESPFKAPKPTTTLQLASNYNRYQQQKSRLLKQLEQLGLNVAEYAHLNLNELTQKTEYIMNNTYSIKYLGLNKN